ncbi:hypothetical protein NP233_g6717 [Leucocoprinus birnbaumii]|uniref:carbonic anhydrase n=1 Tax=Leucocoprinus birnbaumii TaxID=56174 RepID=A0AAD5VQI7_9AGAR|nr:hypothetical protein NP233_g6717 [Leucocoprinus birnbaumii]
MPFSALVQRQFSLRTSTKALSTVSTGQARGITTNLSRKRRTNPTTETRGLNQSNAANALGLDRTAIPAWVTHLESFRHRSFCTTSVPQLTNLLGSGATTKVPLHGPNLGRPAVQTRSCKTTAQYVADIEKLVAGNQVFREDTLTNYPSFFEESAKGQKPPYMLIDCSDSRVAEQAIFDAQPGTMFTSGSIANQFHEWDLNSNSVLSYAVETLEVKHVIVMGHYGCGGVAASMLPVSLPLERPAHIAVQTWIQPIREIYQTSTRPEIVAHRERHKHTPLTELPDLHDPAFRALVEENVKANVNRIATSYVMRDHYASLPPQDSSIPAEPTGLKSTHVFIHGWVYDLENGEVTDLNVTIGPPGRDIPKSPWPSTAEREKQKRIEREAKLAGSA